ncbi:MAG: hypothetical protein JRI25_24880 [Deltaproteobacteria bacterium]|nr:hypothetical protein [Deltaproteobacteria bacterium]MBW2257815.1 hypothetical protein [Deltaproteobacteria bacterium]
MRRRDAMALNLLTAAASSARWGLARTSDRTWLRMLRLARLPGPNPALDEVIDILEAGPPTATVLRRMVNDTPREEIRDMLWGTLFFESAEL